MYAVFQIAGFQYNAEEGSVIKIPTQQIDKGSKLDIDEVLLIKKDGEVMVGTPFVEGARIEAEVVDHSKGDKIVIYKYKRRTKYRRTQGHRQDYSDIKINKIVTPES